MQFRATFMKSNMAKNSADNRGKVSQTQKPGRLSEDDVAAAVLRVIGEEPDTFDDIDDHPASLDLAL